MRGRGWGLGRRADGSMKGNWRSGGVGGEATEEFKCESTSMKAERNRKLKPFPEVTNYFRVLLSDVTKYHQLASATFQFCIIEVKKRCDVNSTNTKQCPWWTDVQKAWGGMVLMVSCPSPAKMQEYAGSASVWKLLNLNELLNEVDPSGWSGAAASEHIPTVRSTKIWSIRSLWPSEDIRVAGVFLCLLSGVLIGMFLWCLIDQIKGGTVGVSGCVKVWWMPGQLCHFLHIQQLFWIIYLCRYVHMNANSPWQAAKS